MIATICLYALVSVSESVSVKFSALYLVSKVSEKSVISPPLERSLAKLCKAGNNHNLMMYVLTQIRIMIAAYPNKERSLKCVIVKVSNHANFSGVWCLVLFVIATSTKVPLDDCYATEENGDNSQPKDNKSYSTKGKLQLILFHSNILYSSYI